jgi:hypothetical protein
MRVFQKPEYNIMTTEIETTTPEITSPFMAKLMTDAKIPPEVDALVEGPVLGVAKSSVYIDLGPVGTGIIYGREFINAVTLSKSST